MSKQVKTMLANPCRESHDPVMVPAKSVLHLWGIILIAIVFIALYCVNSSAQGLQVTYGSAGLQTLSYNGVTMSTYHPTYHKYDSFYVWGCKRRVNGQDVYEYDWTNPPINVTADVAQHKVTNTYSWGNVSCTYSTQGDKITAVIKVTNTSATDTFMGIQCHPFQLFFPSVPPELDDNLVHVSWNSKGPVAIRATFTGGSAVVTNDDVAGADTYVGMQQGIGWWQGSGLYELTLATFRYGWYPGDFPDLNDPIAPQSSKTYTVSMRFGTQTALTRDLAADVYQNYRNTYPFKNFWNDRRPLGATFLASFGNGNSPRNWLGDLYVPSVDGDISTTTAKTNFRTRLLELADRSIARCQYMNGQGIITWDIEGQQYPHAISYIGDPSIMADLTPEMEFKPTPNSLPTVDEYFKKIRDAGYVNGLTIRPQIFARDSDGQGGYTNVRQIDATDATQFKNLIISKATYAKNRWGIKVFYVDSDVIGNNISNPPQVFDQVKAALPDCLFIPEWGTTHMYASTAPYGEILHTKNITPAEVRDVYPEAFSYIVSKKSPQETDSIRTTLIAAVRQGDILGFTPWYPEPRDEVIKSIYLDAGLIPCSTAAYNGSFEKDLDANGTPDQWNLPKENSVPGSNGPAYVRPNVTSGSSDPYVYKDLLSTISVPFKYSTNPIQVSYDIRDTSASQFDTYQIILHVAWEEAGITYTGMTYCPWTSTGTKNTSSWRTITRNTNDGSWSSTIYGLSSGGHSIANGQNQRITQIGIRCVDYIGVQPNTQYAVLIDNVRLNYTP